MNHWSRRMRRVSDEASLVVGGCLFAEAATIRAEVDTLYFISTSVHSAPVDPGRGPPCSLLTTCIVRCNTSLIPRCASKHHESHICSDQRCLCFTDVAHSIKLARLVVRHQITSGATPQAAELGEGP